MDPSLYHRFFEVEERHWWFVARQQIVLDVVRRVLGPGNGRPALDVGCGTGAFLKELSTEWRGWGTDTSDLAVDYAQRRGCERVLRCTLDSFPHPGERFELITALDVIEHIDDDVTVLRQMGGLLTPAGRVVVTVPAYPWLWSKHDDVNHHCRRYTRSTLERSLVAAGLDIEEITYFNTLLFPLALVQRFVAKLTGALLDDGLTVPAGWMNATLKSVFAYERHLVGRVGLPFGLSLMAVARRGRE
jgi:SAM-dependent methyltransferase